ncbi:MAG: hypothetical protein ACYCQJ_10000 [Nitrososphaerales archaeon]
MRKYIAFIGIVLLLIGLFVGFQVETCSLPNACVPNYTQDAISLIFLIIGACVIGVGLFSKRRPMLDDRGVRADHRTEA